MWVCISGECSRGARVEAPASRTCWRQCVGEGGGRMRHCTPRHSTVVVGALYARVSAEGVQRMADLGEGTGCQGGGRRRHRTHGHSTVREGGGHCVRMLCEETAGGWGWGTSTRTCWCLCVWEGGGAQGSLTLDPTPADVCCELRHRVEGAACREAFRGKGPAQAPFC